MTFRYSHTFPISGPNKLPRFKQWAAENIPGVALSLPPQVPVKSEALTVRLKSIDDRTMLIGKLEGVSL
ncbi:hypothetical protein [Shinella zoogloeoides]|uniref:hypothetical protein n=1 Tax=Shinella zoogloeoides TaxID=352475 RepID=UPI00273D8372|nr:hypothetical protein [Shinella zoogloeoides]WLR91643.1 hypothetical protein Q9316_14230 [Shinella zoogloeoides]